MNNELNESQNEVGGHGSMIHEKFTFELVNYDSKPLTLAIPTLFQLHSAYSQVMLCKVYRSDSYSLRLAMGWQ